MSGGADLVARLRLEASAGNTPAVLAATEGQVRKVGAAGTTAAGGLRQAEAATDGFERSAAGASRAGLLLGTALGALGGRELLGHFKDAAFQAHGMATGLEAVTGGSLQAASAQGFVRQEASRLGLVIRQQTEGFLSLAASTNGTALAGQKTKDIWLGLVTAGTALGTSDEKRARALEAVSQMASKVIVSQEELRGQLSEALPGSLQVAERAMGLTTQEFNKLVESGKLLATDFLPKFAAQLQKEFGPKLTQSLTTPLGQARVELAELANIGDLLSADTGTAFLEGLVGGVRELNDELSSGEVRQAAKELGQDLGAGLSAAAQGAAFLVDHLDEVQMVATAVVGVGLSKWLVGAAIDARATAAAFLAKGVATKEAAALTTLASGEEIRAATTLRGALESRARAEVVAANAARQTAIADEQAALAAVARARAEAAATTGGLALADNRTKLAAAERGLEAAQTATAAASIRNQAAAANLAKVTTAGGAAAQGAKALFGGLTALLGGPWGIALAAAAGGVFLLTKHMEALEKERADFAANTASVAKALADTDKYARSAASGVDALGLGTKNATGPTDGLAKSMGRFADETYRAAAAQKELAINSLMKAAADVGADITRLEGKVKQKSTQGSALTGAMLGDAAFSGLGQSMMAEAGKVSANDLDQQLLAQRRKDDAKLQERIQLLGSKDTLSFAPPKAPSATPDAGKPDKARLKAREQLQDLDDLAAAENRYTEALMAGGAALDRYRIQEAGRQAVERLGLADRPKLTAAEKALVEQIKKRAEDTERLKIANDRIEKSIGLKRSAEADTKALRDRAVAATQGEAALEALQVKEAGLAALQQIGVESLDQLTGKTLEHAEAAITAAEAKERQAIATAKAERVAGAIDDLNQRIAAEEGYASAVAGGIDALVAYQREQFVTQELERAGKTLTAEQTAEIRKRAEALFSVSAAGDAADLTKRQAEELRLAKMTNQERSIETRFLERQSLLRRQHLDWTIEEVDARARALALAEQAAAEDAAAIGDLKEGLRQAFIESGKLGFEDVGEFVEQRLRQAVFDALLAKPIDIVINAVVGSLSGTNLLGGANAGLGTLGGSTGLLSLFNSAGALKGLTSGASNLAMSGLNALGYNGIGAAKLAGGIGGAIGGAGTGMMVSSVADLLGIKQTKGNQIGGTIGGAIGSFIPIPGGAIIGSVLGNLVGGLVGGKPSNQAAVASLDSSGKVTSIGGDKRTDATVQAAQTIADSVAQIQAALVAGGATLTATVSKIDIGVRDSTHLNFSDGKSIDTAVGDVAAAIDAATKTIIAGAKWGSEAQTAYAQKMLVAGATIDQVVAAMSVVGGFAGGIDDALAQLVDPAAYAKKQALDAIEANYTALKTQAKELIEAGLATEDVLGKIDQLKDLQVAEALKRLGSAADGAAVALDPEAFKASIGDSIAQLTNPVGFERAKALAEINSQYETLKAQAEKLIEAGKLPAEVLNDLASLRDLQIADSVKRLGSAAGDTAAALEAQATAAKNAQGFGQSVGDSIAQLLDPVGFERTQALAGINANYDALVAQARKMVDAGTLTQAVFGQLEQLRDLQVADSIKRLGDASTDAAAALEAQATAAKEAGAFGQSIDDAIAQLLDPVGYERDRAKRDINANYDAMLVQARKMVDAGTLTQDVFGQLEQLRDLQLADSIKKLGDASSDAADAIRTKAEADRQAAEAARQAAAERANFGASIGDSILGIADPTALKKLQIQRSYDTRVGQAKGMFEGEALADMLGQIGQLRDLELGQLFASLAGAVTQTADAFDEAKPRLQAWLNSVAVGSNSPLNPMEQRGAALSAYEATLAKARMKDAGALSSITGMADQLLSADTRSTASASERLALFQRVTGDIQGLSQMAGDAVGRDPVVTSVMNLSDDLGAFLDAIATNTDPETVADGDPAPVDLSNPEILVDAWRTSIEGQTKDLEAGLDKLRIDLGGKADRNGDRIVQSLGQMTQSLATQINTLAEQVARSSAAQDVAAAVGDLTRQMEMLMALVAKAARP